MLLNSMKSGSRSAGEIALKSFALAITPLERCGAFRGHKEFFAILLAMPFRNILVETVSRIPEPGLIAVFERTCDVCGCEAIFAFCTQPNGGHQKLFYLVRGRVLVSQKASQGLPRIGISHGCDRWWAR